MADIRISGLPNEPSPSAADVLPIDGVTTRKTTIQAAVEAGRPAASQAEAEAGTNPTKVMTPLTTSQAVSFYGLTKAGNLAGLADKPTARSNLDLGNSATRSVGTTAGTVAAGDDSRIVNALQANSDGSITTSSTTVSNDWSAIYGGAWKSAAKLLTTLTSIFSGSRSVLALVMKTTGTGENGPARADYGLFISSEKVGDAAGEIDGINIAIKQGSVSDAGGILIDMTKEGGVPSGGGMVGVEISSKETDSLGAVVRSIQTIHGFGLENEGSLSAGTGYGFEARATLGATFSAYHVNQTSGSWDNIFTAYVNNTTEIASIRGDGRAFMDGYFFTVDKDTGVARVSADQIGLYSGGILGWYVASNRDFYPGLDVSFSIGANGARVNRLFAKEVHMGATGDTTIFSGSGAPSFAAEKGSLFLRNDGGAGSTLYVNETGTSTWRAI